MSTMKHSERWAGLRPVSAGRRAGRGHPTGIQLAAALALSLAPACGGIAHASGWEYKVVFHSDLAGVTSFEGAFALLGQVMSDPAQASRDHQDLMIRSLNELGRDGWELAAQVDNQLIFKRRAPP